MKDWLVSGYITVPVYQVVQGETEDEAFDSFVELTKQEHGDAVDYDYTTLDLKDDEDDEDEEGN